MNELPNNSSFNALNIGDDDNNVYTKKEDNMTAVVWSKVNCPQCDKAKHLLTANGIQYHEKVIGNGYTREDLLQEVPTAKSVPQVFINGSLIGGFSELQTTLRHSTT